MRTLATIEAEIDALAEERRRLWQAWQRDTFVGLRGLQARREQLRQIERTLARLWLEKRYWLCGHDTERLEAYLWRMLAKLEAADRDDELDDRGAALDAAELASTRAGNEALDSGAASGEPAGEELEAALRLLDGGAARRSGAWSAAAGG